MSSIVISCNESIEEDGFWKALDDLDNTSFASNFKWNSSSNDSLQLNSPSLGEEETLDPKYSSIRNCDKNGNDCFTFENRVRSPDPVHVSQLSFPSLGNSKSSFGSKNMKGSYILLSSPGLRNKTSLLNQKTYGDADNDETSSGNYNSISSVPNSQQNSSSTKRMTFASLISSPPLTPVMSSTSSDDKNKNDTVTGLQLLEEDSSTKAENQYSEEAMVYKVPSAISGPFVSGGQNHGIKRVFTTFVHSMKNKSTSSKDLESKNKVIDLVRSLIRKPTIKISKPYDMKHPTHVYYDPNKDEFVNLPKEWETVLKSSGIELYQQDTDIQAILDIVQFYQDTQENKSEPKIMATFKVDSIPDSNQSYSSSEPYFSTIMTCPGSPENRDDDNISASNNFLKPSRPAPAPPARPPNPTEK